MCRASDGSLVLLVSRRKDVMTVSIGERVSVLRVRRVTVWLWM